MTSREQSSPATARWRSKARDHVYEHVARNLLRAAAWVSVTIMLGIVAVLIFESLGFFQHVGPFDFLLGTKWSPLIEPRSFGVLPLIAGTTLVAAIAALVALPLGTGSALFLAEIATPRIRRLVKPVLEILAGVPTIVYGYFGLTFVTPLLRSVLPQTNVFNAAAGGIVVGIMVLPMIASLCDDAFHAVPNTLRHAGRALGATRAEVATSVVLPAAGSGVLAAWVLAAARAIGETMAVTLAAGATPRLTFNPLESIQTMTAYMVQVSMGDTPHGTVEYQSLFAVGLLLFAMTLGMNLAGQRIRRMVQSVPK